MKKSISWTTLASFTLALSKFLMIWLIAKELSTYSVGIYAIATAIISPIMLLANMRLRTIYVKNNEGNSIHNFLKARTLIAVLSIIVILIISALFYREVWMIFFFVALMRALDLYADLLYGVLQRDNNLKLAAQYLIGKQLLLTVVFAIALLVTRDLLVALVYQTICQIIYTWIEKKTIAVNTTSNETSISLKSLLLIGLPLGFTQLIVSLNTFIPRYILENIDGATILGYFTIISYITVLSNIVIGSITQSFLRPLSKLTAVNKRNQLKNILYKKLYGISLVLFLLLFIVVYFFGEIVLTIVFDSSYAQYSTALLLMTFCVFWNAMNWHVDNVLIIFNRVRSSFLITCICLVISLPINYYLIAFYSLDGAVYAMIFNYFILFICKQVELSCVLKRGEANEI